MKRKNLLKNGCCFADKIKNSFCRLKCKDSVSKLSKRAKTGRVKVCKVTGDRKVCARMAAMGLYPGVEADIICPAGSSQCLLKIHGGTISLDPDISENIYVTNL